MMRKWKDKENNFLPRYQCIFSITSSNPPQMMIQTRYKKWHPESDQKGFWIWDSVNGYLLSNRHLRIVVAKCPIFCGWKTTAHVPKQTEAAAITKIRRWDARYLLVNKRLQDFLGLSSNRFILFTTSLLKSGKFILWSTEFDSVIASKLPLSINFISCNFKSHCT